MPLSSIATVLKPQHWSRYLQILEPSIPTYMSLGNLFNVIMTNCKKKKKRLQISSMTLCNSLDPHLAKWLCHFPHQVERSLFLHSLNLGWCCDLLYHRSDICTTSSPGLKESSSFCSHSPKTWCFCTRNSGLSYWIRKLHGQRWPVSTEAI